VDVDADFGILALLLLDPGRYPFHHVAFRGKCPWRFPLGSVVVVVGVVVELMVHHSILSSVSVAAVLVYNEDAPLACHVDACCSVQVEVPLLDDDDMTTDDRHCNGTGSDKESVNENVCLWGM
jgi:hypothetical protein